MITAILTGDNHLGTNYTRFRPERLEGRRARLREAFGCIVDAAIERQVDLFLHTGDLFDRPDPRNIEREFVARQWSKLKDANIPIFAIAGNHDAPRNVTYGGGIVPQEEAHALGALHLFRKTDTLESVEIMTKHGQKVRVSGLTTDFNRANETCPLENLSLERCNLQTVEIVLLHYGIEGWMPKQSEEPTILLSNLERIEADFIGVGHLHKRLARTLKNGALVVNAGSSERMDFGEEAQNCGYTYLELEPGNVRETHCITTMQRMQTEDFLLDNHRAAWDTEIGDDAKAKRLTVMLHDTLEQVSHRDCLLRFRITGSIPRDLYHTVDWMKLQDFALGRNFHCQIETEQMRVYDPAYDLPEGYGVSFDIESELEIVLKRMNEQFRDREDELEINGRASELVKSTYEKLMRGARA